MRKSISKMSVTELVDLFGEVNFQKKTLSEFEDRLKDVLSKKKKNSEILYGDLWTIKFSNRSRNIFDKAVFVAEYGQKLYDKYIKKTEYKQVDVNAVDTIQKPSDTTVLIVDIPTLGCEFSAKKILEVPINN